MTDETVEERRWLRENRMFRQVAFTVVGMDETDLFAQVDSRMTRFAGEDHGYEIVQMNVVPAENPLDGAPWSAHVTCVREAGVVPWA